MGYAVGLDIGSTSTKLIVLSGDKIITHHVMSTGANSRKAGQKILQTGLENKGLKREDMDFLVSTGYGRHMVDFGKPISEITCQAKGIKRVYPETQVIIDIGGQDFKIIQLNKVGRVSNFAMNDKCAAGTGRYLELMAGIFAMDLDVFSKNADFSNKGAMITSVCTVFAETEVINHITKGTKEEEIIAGIFMAVSRRVYSSAKRFIGDSESLVFTGGVAKNVGVATALEHVTQCSIQVPDQPQITAALGAAVFAQEMADKTESFHSEK